MSTLHQVTAASFEADVLQSPTPVLVDFWAPWCVPCRVLAPQIERVARETPSVKFVALNAEDFPEIAQTYGVTGLPSVVLFVEGQEVSRKVGAVGGYGAIKKLVEAL